MTPPGGIFAHIAGEDLVQGEDGRWWVLEDNLRIPSGASYPLFVRDIERRISPRLFRDVRIRDNREYPRLLRKAMDFVSTEGIAVVLTPGRYNSAFFEHAYLAEKTGAALAFPEDLEVVDNKVYFLDYAGKRHRVGVVYRRLSDEFLDPFAFNPDSVIGVPGILSAYRAGNVAIVNAPGNGAADDKAVYYFVPQMIKYYLGEEPILNNAPTYMPMFEADRKEVLNRMGELVIKDVAEAGGYGVVFGSSLDAAAREELANRIKEEPRRFIAQEVIQFRDIDVVDPKTGEMSPRKCDLRAFVVTGKNTHVWYSGLTRYSSVPGQMIVNSSQGGGFKDTWVLAPESGVEHEYGAETQVANLLSQSRHHSLSLVTASKADNLYWLGRYTERAFTTLNQFFPFYDRVMDTDVDAFRPFAHALDLPEDFEDFDGFVNSFLYDGSNPDSVRSAVTSAFNNAVILRPELSSRLLQYVELAMTNITDAAKYAADAEDIYKQRDITDDMLAFWGGIENSPVDPTLKAFIFIGKYLERIDLYTRFGLTTRLLQYVELAMTNITDAAKYAADAEDIYKQRDITDDMLAFWGGIENSPVDPTLKAFIFIGKYLERIDLYTRFGLTMEELEAPLKKLAAYSMTLDGMPLPSCFADGLSWLVGQLPSRGYQEVADLLKKYLDDYSGRVSALAIKDMGSLSSMNMDAKRP